METTDKIKIYGKWLTDKKWGELRVTLAPCCMAQGPAGPGLEGGRLCILSESLVLVLQAPPPPPPSYSWARCKSWKIWIGLVWAGFYSRKYQKENMINSTTHDVHKIRKKKLVTDKKHNCCWNGKWEKDFSSDSSQRTLCAVSWKMFSAMSGWRSRGVS